MLIIIDGYNILKRVFSRIRGKLDKQREELLSYLAFYKDQKREHDITVVFDGGGSSHALREIYKGIVVVYSGVKRSADEWILDYIERHKEFSMLLITEDRALVVGARSLSKNIDTMSPRPFYEMIRNIITQEVASSISSPSETILKYDRAEDEDIVEELQSAALDLLMKEVEMEAYSKEEEPKKMRISSSHKASKQERKKLQKLRKI